MKNVLMILTVIALLGFQPVNAQDIGIKLGADAGIPVGDADLISNFNLGLDAAYLFDATPSFKVGPLVGYSHFFIRSGFAADDIQFLPLAVSPRYYVTEDFFLGTDLGYAVGLTDGLDGGFYYRPKAGYNLGPVALVAKFSGISDEDFTYASFNFGVEYGF